MAPLPEGPLPERTLPMSLQETERFYRKIFGNEVAEAHRVLLHAGRDAFPLLLQMLGERETRLQRFAAHVRRVGEKHIQIRPSGYHVSREQAITALLDLQRGGCDLGPIMPEIRKLAKDSDQEVSNAATFLVDMIVRARSTTKSAGMEDAAKQRQ